MPMSTVPLPADWPISSYIATLQAYLPQLAAEYDLALLGVFGSYTRNQQTPTSDLDLLVEFSTTSDLFQYIELQQRLGKLLGVPVDLVHRAGLKPTLRTAILEDLIVLRETSEGIEHTSRICFRQFGMFKISLPMY